MRLFILSALLLASLAAGQTSDGIEITKQRLVKFPEDSYDPNVAPLATGSKADEAQRILQQIAKVNEAFGYVKKTKPEQPKLPPILDSSQYLFPKPAQSPFHAQQHHFSGSMGQTLLEPSIRAVKLTRNAFNDQQTKLYFRPRQVELPPPNSAQEAQQLPAHFVIPVHLYRQNKEQYLREHAPHEYRVKGYKIIGDVDSFYGKAKKQGKSTPKYHLFFLPRELAFNDDGTLKRGTNSTTTTKAPKKESRLESREKMQPQRIPVSVVQEKTTKPVRVAAKEGEQMLPKVTTAAPTTHRLTGLRVPSVNLAEMQNQTSTAIKNAFQNIFKMPFRATTSAPKPNGDSLNIPDDYKWLDEQEGGGDGDSDTAGELEDSSVASEKHLFAHKNPHKLMQTIGEVATAHQETQKQALREGGIIIQRLKVRKGGIAIAGPGGVATAGSGGTAIVGPGGYALTHPRSLTIAGPGAKVISIPAEVDLKDALQRTDVQARSFPREGKVVATGPTVYYAPPTGLNEGEQAEVDDVDADFEA
ncbi:hypothetical protein ACLKA7_017294 [Drosophila subpalustris]